MMCLRTGLPIRDVLMGISRPRGGRAWILINSEPVEVGVATTFMDITAEMDSAHERLRATVDSMLDPHLLCVAVRDEDRRVVDVVVSEANEVACAFLTLPRREVVGSSFGSVDQESTRLVGDWVRNVFEWPRPAA